MSSLRYQQKAIGIELSNHDWKAPRARRSTIASPLPLYLKAHSDPALEHQAASTEGTLAAAGPAQVQAATEGVPLHHDAAANRKAQAEGAQAMTTGGAILFNQGQYNPSSATGRALIGHELAHVAQQHAGLARGVQRKTLADAGPAERQKLELPSAPTSLPDETLKEYFEKVASGGYGTARPAPTGVAVELGGIDATFKTPMTSVAMHLFAQVSYSSIVPGATKPILGPGQTVTLRLALQKYGLADANYRFAWTGTEDSGTIYIEALGAGPKEETAPAIDPTTSTVTVGGLTFTTTGPWTPARLGQLRTALALFPLKALEPVDKLKFHIDAGASPSSEEGSYGEDQHVVTIYTSLFDFSDTRFGASPKPVQEIAHEIAHAIDRAPLRAVWQQYQSTGKAGGLTKAVSPSGSKWGKDAGGTWQIEERMGAKYGAFRTAATQDGVVKTTSKIKDAAGAEQSLTHLKGGVSDYSNTNWTELFAESLALYATDPATLQLIRPNIYAYFSKQFPRQAKQ
ncbi:MAG: DUF4157 domain-containing protein [Caldilineaceae bacterium]